MLFSTFFNACIFVNLIFEKVTSPMILKYVSFLIKAAEIQYFLRSGATNLGNYHNNHHSPDHHRLIRQKYSQTENLINQLKACLLRGCVSSLAGSHNRTPGNSLVQAISQYARITTQRRNAIHKSHGSNRINVHGKYGPVREIIS